MIDIIPAILAADEAAFLKDLRAILPAAPIIHIDICDGAFVPTVSWADPVVLARELAIDCELHLMVADPVARIQAWKGISRVKRALIHLESTSDFASIASQCREEGWGAHAVLNPDTPLSAFDACADHAQGLMLMGVTPGKQGQHFIPETIERLSSARIEFPDHYLAVDGSVNETTIPDILGTGVNAVCVGSALFKTGQPPAENFTRIRRLVQQLTPTANG
jgi:ribulose-phosphate 3-epimerase